MFFSTISSYGHNPYVHSLAAVSPGIAIVTQTERRGEANESVSSLWGKQYLPHKLYLIDFTSQNCVTQPGTWEIEIFS